MLLLGPEILVKSFFFFVSTPTSIIMFYLRTSDVDFRMERGTSELGRADELWAPRFFKLEKELSRASVHFH